MFRVFDTELNEWVNDNVYLNSKGELFLIKQSVFGWVKIPLELSQDRYIYHRDIDLYDKDGCLVFVGDYVLAHVAENRDVIGVVCYANDLSAYIILCKDNEGNIEYFILGSEVTEFIEVVGNVFDGYAIDNYDELSL